METDVAAFVDPRTKENGVRLLCCEESFEPESDVLMMANPKEQYDAIRMILGLPEGSSELGGQFPLNMNLHMLNAVSFSKGCYIGQELTQRTFHTGMVRRLALPFVINSVPKGGDTRIILDVENFSPFNAIDKGYSDVVKGETILDAKGKKLGKVIAQSYNIGIALCDIRLLNKNGPTYEYSLGSNRVYLWQPTWLSLPDINPEEAEEPQEEAADK
jgi:folate-binding protein YgfZ